MPDRSDGAIKADLADLAEHEKHHHPTTAHPALLARLASDVAPLLAARDEAREELEELRDSTFPKSWAGFRAFLEEAYPDDIFPDNQAGLGPEMVRAARRLAVLEAEVVGLRRQVQAVREAVKFSPRSMSLGEMSAYEAKGVLSFVNDLIAVHAALAVTQEDTDDH